MKLQYISYIIFFVLLLFVPGIAAADFIAPLSLNYTLVVSCEINGNYCNPSEDAVCNLTLRDPLGKYIARADNMSFLDNGDAYIVLNSSALNRLGKYPGKVSCAQNGLNNTETFILEIVGSRESTDYSFFLILSISGIVILLLGIYMGNFYLGFLSGVLILGAGMYSMIYGIGTISNLYSQMVAISLLGIGLTINIAAGLQVIEEMRVKFS